MSFKPRYLTPAFIILALIFPALSCKPSETTTATRRTLLIYTPHGQDMLNDFIARYKQTQAGADVDVRFMDMGSQEVLRRLTVERNRPQADLWWGAAHTTFQTAADENLLAPYRPTWADKLPAESRDAEDRWYATYETPEVIIYNSASVTAADAPKDWDDVLDPKWRDKVLIRNPTPSDSMRAIFGAMILRFYQETNSPTGGYDWLRRLDANVHEYTADGTLLMQKLARQEGLITLWNLPDAQIFREQKGFPQLAYTIPTSGTPVILDGIAIVRGAPHEEEARKFYEFVTTPESLVHAARTYYRIPVRAVDLDRTQLPSWMNESFPRMRLDWDLLRKDGGEWLRYWDTEIRGRNK